MDVGWKQCPPDMVQHILQYVSDVIVYRNGRWIGRISRDDDRYPLMLHTIPRKKHINYTCDGKVYHDAIVHFSNKIHALSFSDLCMSVFEWPTDRQETFTFSSGMGKPIIRHIVR